MRSNPKWTGVLGLNDMLLTLCILDRDIRLLTLERIADVVAAGMALQHEKEEREFQSTVKRRSRKDPPA